MARSFPPSKEEVLPEICNTIRISILLQISLFVKSLCKCLHLVFIFDRFRKLIIDFRCYALDFQYKKSTVKTVHNTPDNKPCSVYGNHLSCSCVTARLSAAYDGPSKPCKIACRIALLRIGFTGVPCYHRTR